MKNNPITLEDVWVHSKFYWNSFRVFFFPLWLLKQTASSHKAKTFFHPLNDYLSLRGIWKCDSLCSETFSSTQREVGESNSAPQHWERPDHLRLGAYADAFHTCIPKTVSQRRIQKLPAELLMFLSKSLQ